MTVGERIEVIWPVIPLFIGSLAIYFGANRWIGPGKPLKLVLYYAIAIGFEIVGIIFLLNVAGRIE